ncbi:prephenate dehydratase [Dietzia sp. UCD-THP]|uniref:prephenate dehydratase n=1 Tax=Dietzia sp. UCD-THP TaxID=1292020 RepID=UPI0003782CFA|nr:prephenate dehydratase [Dietzia sp. UCD-THP]EYT62111.1 prephenate dehydratase [Dietzia sp. UCD-THP]
MVTVAYLGPPGTFTDAALHRLRADAHTSALLAGAEAVPAGTPDEALAMVRDGAADYACVPFENSVDGTVNPTGDALAAGRRLQIFAETELDVVFSILVRPGTAAEDVRVLRTHPIAAAQVRRWVGVNLPRAHIETTSSTAAGAEQVAAGDADATAAPARAGEINGLVPLAEKVADVGGARTRFVLVGRPAPPLGRTGHDRTCVIFGLPHEPNALVQALTELSIRDIDLTRIGSRPTRVERFTYLFHVDLVGHIDDPVVAEALAALHHRTADLRFLGSWPVADGVGAGAAPPDRSEAIDWIEGLRRGVDEPGAGGRAAHRQEGLEP